MSITATLNDKTDGNPCVRNCCLDDNNTCLGCGRQLTEILEWHHADSNRQLQIIEQAKLRVMQRQTYKVHHR
ncbi:MAG: DUF1289 domain-containing protein [Spongiibacteraceae bacterium]